MSLPPGDRASELRSGGYLHPDYAASMSEFGTPHHLRRSGSWILIRKIPDCSLQDGTGCYPLFTCRDWSELPADLETMQPDLVTLSVVTDPFASVGEDFLKTCFIDLVRPFKDHFVVDLNRSLEESISAHHQRNVRRAMRDVRVECRMDAEALLDDWLRLYGVLIERHDIRGITRFSPASFAGQLRVPGITAFRAVHGEETVGMTLWYVQGDRAYYHLGAYSAAGYSLKASFALFRQAIEYFKDMGLRWLNLGAGAGAGSDGSDGLSRFKRGWATETRTAYLCGRIFDHAQHLRIVEQRGVSQTDYFPAYRVGEFA